MAGRASPTCASCATSRNRRAQRHEREQPHLLPLPACDFDTALVVYRHVNVEGFITHRLNFYSVPWSYIGQVLPVRITESEVIIYSIGLDEIARHPLVPGTADRRAADASRAIIPPTIRPSATCSCGNASANSGPIAVQFLDGLLAKQIQGKLQAQQLLALMAHYQRDDVLRRPGACRPLRRLLPGRHPPHPRRHGPAQTAAGRTRRPAPGRARSASAPRTDRPPPDQRLSALTLTRGTRR